MGQGLPRGMEPGAVIDVLRQAIRDFRFGQVGDPDSPLADAQSPGIESPVLRPGRPIARPGCGSLRYRLSFYVCADYEAGTAWLIGSMK